MAKVILAKLQEITGLAQVYGSKRQLPLMNNFTILTVDDEPNIRTVLRMCLARDGFDVMEAADGKEAIEAIVSNPLKIHLVITDIRMPIINGLEFIAYLTKEWPSIPIIALTGYPDTEMAVSLIRSGQVKDFLVKPITGDSLIHSVRRELG